MFVSASNCLTYKRFVRENNFQFTCRRSSPWAYSRWEANSTEKPTNGLRCRPCMNPSTMPRARSSRLSSREKKTGSASVRVSKDISVGSKVVSWSLATWPSNELKDPFSGLGFERRLDHMSGAAIRAAVWKTSQLVKAGHLLAVQLDEHFRPRHPSQGVAPPLFIRLKPQCHLGICSIDEHKESAICDCAVGVVVAIDRLG